jgi:hypothetical protein
MGRDTAGAGPVGGPASFGAFDAICVPGAFEGEGAGGATAPGDGGATPIIVALAIDFGHGAGAGPAAAGGAARGAAATGEFIMSIVPLNLGAAAPLRLKPHFWHFTPLSSFCVPQFGQNTHLPPIVRIHSAPLRSRGSVHCAGMVLKGTWADRPLFVGPKVEHDNLTISITI